MSKKADLPASVEEIKILNNRAQKNYLFYDEKNEERRHIEAFFLQAVLFEGVLTRLGLEVLGKKNNLTALKGKRKNRYGIDNAINDLYLLGKITTKEFSDLEKFKNKRNELIHNLLSKNIENIEKETKEIYEEYDDLLLILIKKLERTSRKFKK